MIGDPLIGDTTLSLPVNPLTHQDENSDSAMNSSSTWSFNQILDHIDVGILVLDLEKERIEYRNPNFFHVLADNFLCNDYSSLCLLFSDHLNLSPEGPRHGSVFGKIKLKERILVCSVYHFANRYRCLFMRDITERIRLETIAQAVNSTDSLGFIFSGIRHEIGNPLNSLKMTLSVMKQNIGHFSENTLEEYVDRGLADIGRVEYLLKSLKNFSMFECVNLTNVSFKNYLKSFLTLAAADLQQRGIHLIVTSCQELATVSIDPRAMNQVLLNVVANAVDALENRTHPEIHISTILRDQLVWLTIRDNGCGISLKQQKHLFQPFNSSKASGNGLGLVITRKLLALMDSSIEIESLPDKGTTVTISIPAI
jgi:signal transduction histidine kinase